MTKACSSVAQGEIDPLGTAGQGLTVTEMVFDVTTAPVLSVTLSSKCQVPVVVDAEVAKVKLDEVAPLIVEKLVVPGASTSHWYV
jgi:hypothetical protein